MRQNVEKTVVAEPHIQIAESDPLLEDYEYKHVENAQVFPSAEIMSQEHSDEMEETIEEDFDSTINNKIENEVDNKPEDKVKKLRMRDDIIALCLVPVSNRDFAGEELLEVLEYENYFYGKMHLFHCHENNDPKRAVLYSIASLVQPGTFDYNQMSHENYRGIIIWMTLDEHTDIELFEKMLKDAKHLAYVLDATLCDDRCRQLTLQSISKIRLRIKDLQTVDVF
jgi:cell division protein ZipA